MSYFEKPVCLFRFEGILETKQKTKSLKTEKGICWSKFNNTLIHRLSAVTFRTNYGRMMNNSAGQQQDFTRPIN